jgi:hypothetical protein
MTKPYKVVAAIALSVTCGDSWAKIAYEEDGLKITLDISAHSAYT